MQKPLAYFKEYEHASKALDLYALEKDGRCAPGTVAEYILNVEGKISKNSHLINIGEHAQVYEGNKKKIKDCPTFAEIWKKLIVTDLSHLSHRAYINYKVSYQHFSKLHDRRIDDITLIDLQPYFDDLMKKGTGQSKMNNMKIVLNYIFNYAIKYDYIEKNYVDFLKKGSDNEFDMSHTVLRKRLFPILNNDFPVFFILIDNLRYDHWKVLQQRMQPYLKTLSEDTYMSILPSVTHYARNSMFAGLLPSEIEKKYPDYWVAEDSGQYKNQNEKLLLEECLKRFGKEPNFTYNKVLNQSYGLKIIDYLPKMMSTPLNIIIYNFIDMLSHASTEIELLREMANDDDSYRSLVGSWFDHSPLLELIKNLANRKAIVIITSDHGSIRITNPVRIKGDRETSVNLRYKVGRNLEFNPKEVFSIRNPGEIFLPKVNITSSFVFCRQNDFFVYPNNFNQYVAYYRNTIQHGGISLEEMLVPYAVLQPK